MVAREPHSVTWRRPRHLLRPFSIYVTLVVLLLLPVVSFPVLPHGSHSAHAFPADGRCIANDGEVTYRFVGSWPSGPRSDVKQGIEAWNGHRDHDGLALVSFVETTDNDEDVEIYWEDLDAGLYGTATCSTIRVDNDTTDSATVRGIAHHEAGHVVAVQYHSGTDDSVGDGVTPAMQTCADASTNGFSQDDVGGLIFSKATTVDFHAAMANFGFEDGLDHWGSRNTSDFSTLGPAGFTGTRFARVDNTTHGADAHVYQTMNFVTDPQSYQFRARAAWKEAIIGQSGAVRVRLLARKVDYAPLSEANCASSNGSGQWITERAQNQRDGVGSWSSRISTIGTDAGTGNWALTTTVPWDSYSDGSQDVRVQVEMIQGDIFYLDNVTIQCEKNISICT